MRVLVLGGTVFLSAAVASEAVARGHAVVEVSTEQSHVREALRALSPRARHWTYVSSCSTYADQDVPGADESARTLAPYVGEQPPGPQDFGAAKAACEQLGHDALGDRLQICRPGLIVGPGDTSDRFGYWVGRFARSGRPVLVPAHGHALVQVIGVGDLAHWIIDSGESTTTGTFTLVGDPIPLGDLLRTLQEVTRHPGPLVAVDDDWLADRGVAYWSGPESLPLWMPATGFEGFGARSNAAAREAGLVLAPLTDTVAEVLVDELDRGVDRFRRAGLPPQIEARLLSQWTR